MKRLTLGLLRSELLSLRGNLCDGFPVTMHYEILYLAGKCSKTIMNLSQYGFYVIQNHPVWTCTVSTGEVVWKRLTSKTYYLTCEKQIGRSTSDVYLSTFQRDVHTDGVITRHRDSSIFIFHITCSHVVIAIKTRPGR